MNHETLRVLFEWLCDCLEDDSDRYHFHFQGGFGFESPHEVVMVFVFEGITVVFRFPANAFHSEGPKSSEPLSADECLQMTEVIQSFPGGFQELFTEPSKE